MAIVKFSVSDEVKKAFYCTFRDQNKSAVIANLMRRAVADSEQQKQRKESFRLLTERRRKRPAASNDHIRAARIADRS